MLQQEEISVGVIDMPSINKALLLDLYHSEKKIFIAEQNNGYIYSQFKDLLFRNGEIIDPPKIIPINTLDQNGKPQFIHSGIYSELIQKFGLSPEQLVETIKRCIE